jgi:hypothetical protein
VTKLTKLRFTLVLLTAALSAYVFAFAAMLIGGFGMSDGGGFS